jgi:hypothetical protein
MFDVLPCPSEYETTLVSFLECFMWWICLCNSVRSPSELESLRGQVFTNARLASAEQGQAH